ncbi:MAG: hypothetical protein J5640_01480 [Bacteroidales bacterium]|nr:hypothetical protein [Bacteroidales bacterium]
MKRLFLGVAALLAGAWQIAAQEIQPDITPVSVRVTIDTSAVEGPIKPMNAVNNGPLADSKQQKADFKILNIPYSRTHDASEGYYGQRVVDVSDIFPDFCKDPDKASSYDFRETDVYIKALVDAGSEPFYRLGQTIENQTAAKYNIYPPKDYKKWAKICEHIIMHYNEGWADGFHYGIRYWEIWNEADLDQSSGRWKTEPRTWGGSIEEFHKFYAVAAKHLKERFPGLKIGGPSYCRIQGTKTYFPQFFEYMRDNKVPIDFISWHKYGSEPSVYLLEASMIREWMREYGYSDAELILNEWNYRRFKGNAPGSPNEYYNEDVRYSLKGAAFAAATMSAMQDAPVDMLMYYDYRPLSGWCGFYRYPTLERLPTYYAFYAWSKLSGSECSCKIEGGAGDIYAVASVKDGKTVLMLTRYDGDNNACNLASVRVSLSGSPLGRVFCHLTDKEHVYTEIPLFPEEDGTVLVELYNNSIAVLEL